MSFYLLRKAIRRLPGLVVKAVPLPEPKITEGYGARKCVGEICQKAGVHSVLLVTDETLFSLKAHETVESSLREAGIACAVFHGISTEPSESIVIEGRKAAIACRADCIVALGGGSVLDSGKIIAASADHPGRSILDYLQKFVFSQTLPMITIPSTAGTGAEQTIGAVVKNAHGVKKATVIVGLNVTDVILDSELTVNMPNGITLCCGIDALSHGLEGCLADVRVSEEDRLKSRECVRLVLENLAAVAEDPLDIDKRQKLFLAANLGGNAINKQLAGYVHAFAHAIGGRYHLSHGEAIAHCLMPVVYRFRKISEEPLFELAQHCGCAGNETEKSAVIDRLLERIYNLLAAGGFLGGLAVLDEADYPQLLRLINADSINYSPAKTLKDREIISILNEIKRGSI